MRRTGNQDSGAGHGGDAFAAADEAEPFHRRRFDADARCFDAENAGHRFPHGKPVRADLRRLAQERHVDIRDAPAEGGNAICGVGEEDTRCRAAPGGLARREVLADVAVADGAEQRVGECMQPDIGVGMPLEAMGVGDLHAAQPHVVAFGKAVHVEAGAVARLQQRGRRRQQALGKLDVGCRRQFHVAPAAGNEAHRQARPFRQSGIVGEIDAPGGCGTAVGFEDDIVAKRLRCLSPPQACTVHGARDGAVRRFLFQRVADRFGGDGARRGVECGDELADKGGREKWPSGVVDQHAVRRPPAQRLEAREDGRLTRGAAADRRQEASGVGRRGALIKIVVLRIDDDHGGIDLRVPG